MMYLYALSLVPAGFVLCRVALGWAAK